MTTRLHCEGSSDDTFGVYHTGSNGEDYDNCANGEPIPFRITSGDESLIVVGQHAPGKCSGWLIGVSPDTRDGIHEMPIPAWPMHFERGERPYSPALIIEVPDDFTIRHIDQ